MYKSMKKGVNKQTFIGDNSWMMSSISCIIGAFLFMIPSIIWENGFTALLALIGVLFGYFGPVIMSSTVEIDEHVDIKKSAGEEYEAIIKRYEVSHPNKRVVFWITLLTAWTGIGWLVAIYMGTSKKLITLPDRMVDELNSLADMRTSNPPVHIENNKPKYVNERVTTIPAKRVRLYGDCKSCSAPYSIFVKPGENAECEHCGTPIGA